MSIKPTDQRQVDVMQQAIIQSHPVTSWLAAFRIKSVVWLKLLFALEKGSYHERVKKVVADKFSKEIITPETLGWFDKDIEKYALLPEYQKTLQKIRDLLRNTYDINSY